MKTHNIAITLAALAAVSSAVNASGPVLSTEPGALGNLARDNKQDSVLAGARTPHFPGTQSTSIPNPCIDAQGKFICGSPTPAPAPTPVAPPPTAPAPTPAPPTTPGTQFPASIDMWCSINSTFGFVTSRPMAKLGGNAGCEQLGSFVQTRPPMSWRVWPEFFFQDATGNHSAADFANPAKFQITWSPACPTVVNGRCQYHDFQVSGTNASGWQETKVTIKYIPTGATKTFQGNVTMNVCGFMGMMGGMGADEECFI